MRLVALEVWSWRGLDHVVLDDLAPDLNLVVGPNEAGKSRLFEALRYALFERYKGESEDKRALRTWGSSEPPSVAVTFEAGGVVWTLKKQFLKQAYARLEGGGRTLTDDDAEARVRELWGTRAIQGRRDIEQFLGLWPLLWVRQGSATIAPHADLNDDTRARLRDALAAQVNEVATGPHGERLVARAERERERYWTATWKETGELAAARARKTEAEARKVEARARRAEAHAAADELARIGTELVALEGRATAQRARVAESRARVEKADEAGKKLRFHEGEIARLRAENELAERSLGARRDLEGRLTDLDARAGVETEALAALRAEESVVAAREATEVAAHALAEAALEAAHAAHLRARRRAQLEEASRRVEAARGALDRARAHQARLADVKDRLAQAPIDDAQIKRLRKAQEAFARASAALEAASAHVVLRATRPLVVDGAALAEGEARAFPCDRPTTIVIEGIARIEVSPGGAELDRHRDAERDARRVLDARLAEANARTLAEAEDAYARRTGLEAQRAQAAVLLAEAAPAGMGALEDELRARDAEVAALAGSMVEEDARATGATAAARPATLAEADASLRVATDAVARTRASRDALKEARAGVHDRVSRRAQTLEQLAGQRSEALATLATMESREELEARASVARQRWIAANELGRALRAELARAGGDDARIMLEQDQSALRSAEAEINARNARRVLLEATLQVRALGSDDLHERVQKAEADAEEASLVLSVVEPRALAVKALVDALGAARREVQERLLAPVLERVHPYLQSLLPGVRLRMDQEWSVLGLEADNQEQDFDALSGGAKEQVSILVRLALAEVLGGGDGGLPIVLDDCLVNTDRERHADMLRVLYKASRRQQIVLFSCHDVPWEGLGESRRFTLPPRRVRAPSR